jgi:hypothetical protein
MGMFERIVRRGSQVAIVLAVVALIAELVLTWWIR